MKVLFLDVDGVLNTSGSRGLHYSLLSRLKSIIEQTDCKIIISSNWRLYDKYLKYLYAHMSNIGIDVEKVVLGGTSYFGTDLRLFEILHCLDQMYIHQYEVDNWCILDDLNLYRQNVRNIDLENHFVRSNHLKGLSSHNVSDCVTILNSPINT